MFVIFLLAQVSPAAAEVPKSPQGVELLFPTDDGTVPKDKKKKDAKAEKAAKRQATLLKKLKAIEKGGDVNAADKKGQTALMLAAAANNRLAVCWLVAKGADVTLKNKKGRVARDLSASIAIRELLRLAADEGKPLTEAERKRYGADKPPTKEQLQQSLCHTIPYVEDLANLIKMGAEPTAWDTDGTPLLEPIGEYCAAPESIAWLARKGVDFTERSQDGKWTGGQSLTPEALRFLLALGAKPDLQSDAPSMCLQAALELNNIPGIRAALEKAPQQDKEETALTLFRHVHSGATMKAIMGDGIPAQPILATFARTCSSRDALAILLDAGTFHFSEKSEMFGPKEIMSRAIAYRHEVLIPQFIAAGVDPNGDYDLLSSAVNACNLSALRVLLAAGAKVSGQKNPLSVLFSFTDLRNTGNFVNENLKKSRSSYMNFPSRGLSQDSLWREECERALDFHAIIDTLVKLGCNVPDTLPLQFLNSPLLGCRKQEQNHCPDLPPALSELLDSPEITVRELLKLCGDKTTKDALTDSMFVADMTYTSAHANFTPDELVRFADIFLKAGADPNAVNNKGKTVLMSAGNIRTDLTKRLLAAGGNPNAVDNDGKTALMYAVSAANEGTIRALLEAGADPGIKDKEGYTALHLAPNQKIAQILLDAGANVHKAEEHKNLLSHLLSRLGIGLSSNDNNTIAFCHFWLEHGAAAPDAGFVETFMDSEKFTDVLPNHQMEVAKMITSEKDVASYRSPKTKRSFLHAAVTKDASWLESLLKAGADINAQDVDGRTPLMYAALYKYWAGRPEAAKKRIDYLLKNGADINAKNNEGKTALKLAKEAEKDDIVKILEECGAKE